MENVGYMTVRVTLGGGAVPVENATVIIRGGGEDAGEGVISESTNRDGVTRAIPLSTPAKSLSLAPGAAALPYSVYDITVSKEGFYTKRISNLAMFSGINATLPVNLIPISRYQSFTDLPKDNLTPISEQNPALE